MSHVHATPRRSVSTPPNILHAPKRHAKRKRGEGELGIYDEAMTATNTGFKCHRRLLLGGTTQSNKNVHFETDDTDSILNIHDDTNIKQGSYFIPDTAIRPRAMTARRAPLQDEEC